MLRLKFTNVFSQLHGQNEVPEKAWQETFFRSIIQLAYR